MNMLRTMILIPVGVLGTFCKDLAKRMQELEIRGIIETIKNIYCFGVKYGEWTGATNLQNRHKIFDVIKQFVKIEKGQETMIQTMIINSRHIRMEFSMENVP